MNTIGYEPLFFTNESSGHGAVCIYLFLGPFLVVRIQIIRPKFITICMKVNILKYKSYCWKCIQINSSKCKEFIVADEMFKLWKRHTEDNRSTTCIFIPLIFPTAKCSCIWILLLSACTVSVHSKPLVISLGSNKLLQ